MENAPPKGKKPVIETSTEEQHEAPVDEALNPDNLAQDKKGSSEEIAEPGIAESPPLSSAETENPEESLHESSNHNRSASSSPSFDHPSADNIIGTNHGEININHNERFFSKGPSIESIEEANTDNLIGQMNGNINYSLHSNQDTNSPPESSTVRIDQAPAYDHLEGSLKDELQQKIDKLKHFHLLILVYDNEVKRECNSALYSIIASLFKEQFNARFANRFIGISEFVRFRDIFSYDSPTITRIDVASQQSISDLTYLFQPEWLTSSHFETANHYLIYTLDSNAYNRAKDQSLAWTDQHVWEIKQDVDTQEVALNLNSKFDLTDTIEANVLFCAACLPELGQVEFFSTVSQLLHYDQAHQDAGEYQPDYLNLWKSNPDTLIGDLDISYRNLRQGVTGYVFNSSKVERDTATNILNHFPQFVSSRLKTLNEIFLSKGSPSEIFIDGYANLLIRLHNQHSLTVDEYYLKELLNSRDHFNNSTTLERFSILFRRLIKDPATKLSVDKFLTNLAEECKEKERQWLQKHVTNLDVIGTIWSQSVRNRLESNNASQKVLGLMLDKTHRYNYFVWSVLGPYSGGASLLTKQVSQEPQKNQHNQKNQSVHISWYYPIHFTALWWFIRYVEETQCDPHTLNDFCATLNTVNAEERIVFSTYLSEVAKLLTEELQKKNSTYHFFKYAHADQAKMIAKFVGIGFGRVNTEKEGSDIFAIAELYALFGMAMSSLYKDKDELRDKTMKSYAYSLVKELSAKECRQLFNQLKVFSNQFKQQYYELDPRKDKNQRLEKKSWVKAIEKLRHTIRVESKKSARGA
jgi:hypothetical protein